MLVRMNENKGFSGKPAHRRAQVTSHKTQTSLMPSYLLNIFTGYLTSILNLDFKTNSLFISRYSSAFSNLSK